MEVTMYDKLLLLPLFQGLGKQDFTTILEKVKFHFQKFAENSYLAKQGDKCNSIIFILDGKIKAARQDEHLGYILSEITDGAPFVLEPYSLFGMNPNYTATYTAVTDSSVVSIDKRDVLRVLNKFEIFQLNYLNLLSNHAQTLATKIWNANSGSNVLDKILAFLQRRCLIPKGEKHLKIRMEDFAALTGETRINISKELNALKNKKLISLSRKEITIPDREELINKAR